MRRVTGIAGTVVMALALTAIVLVPAHAWAQGNSPLMIGNADHPVHMFPTVQRAAELGMLNRSAQGSPSSSDDLIYHSGGPVMTGSLKFYGIFWIPAHLQNGGSTQLSSHYRNVLQNLLHDYPAHGIDNNNTQYYQTINGVTTYIQNAGSLGVIYVDTNPYPASGCSDPDTPGNCITDAQIQAEIQRVMALEGWTGGISHMFLLFTSSGEGSCTDFGCAYTDYCAYHSYISGSTPIIYGNEPYGDTTHCQEPGTPSPNNDVAADTAATAASHEMTEAITDPELNAWFNSGGEEIGDICAYNYGTNTWDSAQANQHWFAHYYELQTEYDNHTSSCQQIGP